MYPERSHTSLFLGQGQGCHSPGKTHQQQPGTVTVVQASLQSVIKFDALLPACRSGGTQMERLETSQESRTRPSLNWPPDFVYGTHSPRVASQAETELVGLPPSSWSSCSIEAVPARERKPALALSNLARFPTLPWPLSSPTFNAVIHRYWV